MSEQVAAYEVLPGPGTRVRERRAPVTRGPRVGTVEKSIGTPPGCVAVRWDGDPSGAQPWCMRLDTLLPERDTPKYAPERELAPGIVVQDDTCDGSPRIAGTRLGTDAIAFYWRREVVEGHKPAAAYRRVAETYGTSIYDVHNAVLFDAGVRAEKERRRAKRQRRAKGTRNEPETGQGDTGAGETRTDRHPSPGACSACGIANRQGIRGYAQRGVALFGTRIVAVRERGDRGKGTA